SETLGNMANDDIINFQERQVIKDKLTEITGVIISDTSTTLPSISSLDNGEKGEVWSVRKSALNAGISSSDTIYQNVATRYNALKSYLENMTPVKPWDLRSSNKDKVINVDKELFRNSWLQYYMSVDALATATTEKLKKNVDDIEIGGRNLATISSVGKWGNGTFNRVDYKYILKNSSGNTNVGLYIDRSQFENSTDYVVSFKVKKISGTVNSMAGHRNSYNDRVYKDGSLIEGATWNSGDQNYNDSDGMHEYVVYFRTTSDAVESSNQPFYIQPNRSAYGEPFEVEIWD